MSTESSGMRGRADRAGQPGGAGPQGGPRRPSRKRGPGAGQPGVAARTAPCVLLADDDDALRDVFARYLSLAGFLVLSACNGTQALSAARTCRSGIDVLVTDVEMPGMSGPELAALLRAQTPGLPVVFVTGNPGSVAEESLGVHAVVLGKPVDLAELLAAVAGFMST